jgi:hypothetical protein
LNFSLRFVLKEVKAGAQKRSNTFLALLWQPWWRRRQRLNFAKRTQNAKQLWAHLATKRALAVVLAYVRRSLLLLHVQTHKL